MPNFKAAFEAASADLSAIMSLLGFTSYPGIDPVLRAITNLTLAKAQEQVLRQHKTDYMEAAEGTKRALEADAQALREEVAEYEALCNRQAELLSQSIIAIRGPEPELTRWGYADLPLRVKTVVEEVAALRARVVVLPSVDSVMNIVMRYQWDEKTNVTGTTNWAANLGMKVVDEVKRLNGKAVSEGLLRKLLELIEHGDFSEGHCMCGSAVDSHGIGDGHAPVDAGEYYAGQVMEELRALLGEGKES